VVLDLNVESKLDPLEIVVHPFGEPGDGVNIFLSDLGVSPYDDQ